VNRHFWAPCDFERHQYLPWHTLSLPLRRLDHPARDSNSTFYWRISLVYTQKIPQIFQPTRFIAPLCICNLLLTSDVTILFMDERPWGILYSERVLKYLYFKIPYFDYPHTKHPSACHNKQIPCKLHKQTG